MSISPAEHYAAWPIVLWGAGWHRAVPTDGVLGRRTLMFPVEHFAACPIMLLGAGWSQRLFGQLLLRHKFERRLCGMRVPGGRIHPGQAVPGRAICGCEYLMYKCLGTSHPPCQPTCADAIPFLFFVLE